MKHEFILEGLHCANCAAKIEAKLEKRYGDVRFSFTTLELEIHTDEADIRDEVQQIVDSIEDGVTVVPKDEHIHHTHDEHDHHHEHDCHDGCCDHDHDHHNHDHHGHEHNHEHGHEGGKVKVILLSIAAVLFIAAFILHILKAHVLICNILSIISAILAGYDVVIEGIKSGFKRRIDETTLMTVAVIAAMVLGEFVEGAAVMVLFGIGELLEDKAVEKSRRDIRKLADIRPDVAYIVENGKSREARAEDVAIGTILEIPPHTRVPLDGIITEGSTTVDASSLTGESEPVDATVGTELLSGMMNNDNTVYLKTTKAYADSAATRIVKLVEESSKNKGNHEKLISRFAAVYTPVMIGLALVIAIIPSLITGDWAEWIHKALVCLVASCPCSIVISVPLSYYAGIGAASKAGVLIKGGRFVEAIANTKAFAFDKTGTITDNQISIKEISPVGSYTATEIAALAAAAEAHSAHPVANALRSYCKEHNISVEELKEHREISSHGVTAQRGNDTITVCKREGKPGISVQLNDSEIGVITLSEHIRSEAPDALKELKALSIQKTVMLSGDKQESCRNVAQGLALDEVHGELLPEDKVKTVEKLIDDCGSCAFVGDGINDAPVLSRATCGIAMGLGSDAAIESADMVLSSESLSSLPRAVRIARKTLSTVKANITFSLIVKALIIILAIMNIAPLWLAVFSDTGVCLLCILNAVRLIRSKNK
ncbi:heavy metal translocating P-type ATPase [uncultured Ruminococcus sp.]|uniref:heavy metal translocating P-type ATPase n=1 Tax=uncultured Ruminococcus sp. TaxID=165186 RepID=UPI00292CF8E6|nr:heavy metal translocating P-type ATPase [uncultured Ruminococcus sp.]